MNEHNKLNSIVERIENEKKQELRDAIVDEINAREQQAEGTKVLNITETAVLMREGTHLLVKLPTVDNPEGIPIGYASSEEDAEAMIATLRQHAPNGLRTTANVGEAVMRTFSDTNAANNLNIGAQAEGVKISRSLTVRDMEFTILTDAKGCVTVRTAKGYKLVTRFDEPLPAAYADELITARINAWLDEPADDDDFEEEYDEY